MTPVSVIDAVVHALLRKYSFMYLYIVILPLGSLVSLIVPKLFELGPFLVFLNFLFADLGIVWYTIFFWLFYFFNRKIQQSETVDVSPPVSKLGHIYRFLIIVITWFILFAWFFGSSIADKISFFMGVRISGHFFVLSSASMSLMLEIKQVIDSSTMPNDIITSTLYYSRLRTTLQDGRWVQGWYILVGTVLVTVVLWYVLVMVTAVLFHVFVEKLLGLFGAYLLVYLTYFV